MNVAERRRTIVWLAVALLSLMMLTFTVEFTNDDGSLFVLGPCCGATENGDVAENAIRLYGQKG